MTSGASESVSRVTSQWSVPAPPPFLGTFPELLAAAGETASRLPMDLASDFMLLLNDKEALHSLNW